MCFRMCFRECVSANVFSNCFQLIKSLEKYIDKLFEWLLDNFLKANPDKCHMLIYTDGNVTLKMKIETITNSSNAKLLGILFKLVSMKMSLHYAGKPPRS